MSAIMSPTTGTLGYDFLTPSTTPAITPSADPMPALITDNAQLRAQVNELKRRIEGFERQIFGQKSERRIVDTDAQVQLGREEPAANSPDKAPAPKARTIAAHTRRRPGTRPERCSGSARESGSTRPRLGLQGSGSCIRRRDGARAGHGVPAAPDVSRVKERSSRRRHH